VLQLNNETPFQVSRAILLDPHGSQVWVVIVKATFRLDDAGRTELDDEQERVAVAPIWAGEPGRSSLLREGEMVFAHPGTDVTINSTARAPGDRPVPELEAGVTVGDLRRALRIFGERRWKAGAFGLRKTAPQPFLTMPITWENAFGGGAGTDAYPANPIGRGFGEQLDGAPLPSVEDPTDLVDNAHSQPAPAGLGAVPSLWSPRREFAGTFDVVWQTTRAPLWPADFDRRFFCAAPPGLWSERHLIGGEPVTLLHLGPTPLFTFELPRVEVVVHTWFNGSRLRQRVRLDRVILEPDRSKVVLVWRSILDCSTEARRVQRSIVSTKEVLR
jgi:hypothetical protein